MKKASSLGKPGRRGQNGACDPHLQLAPPTGNPVVRSSRTVISPPATYPFSGGSEELRTTDLRHADSPPTGVHLIPLATTVTTLPDTAALKDRGTETVIAMQELLKERDVAGILKISVKTLQLWRYEGKGPPYVKIGRCVRYPKDSLAAFVAAHEVRPAQIPGKAVR